MKLYIAKCNKIVSCIYGTRQLVEGLEVPEIFARRFPQYVNCIDVSPTIEILPEVIEETIVDDTIIQEIKTQLRKKIKENEK